MKRLRDIALIGLLVGACAFCVGFYVYVFVVGYLK